MPASRLTGRSGAATAALLALALPALPGGTAAQQPDASAPRAHPFAPPLASPLEPHTRLAPVHVARGQREHWVGLVELGDRFPFWIRRPDSPTADGPGLAGALAGGAFSRFDLADRGNEFIEVHFRVGFRLRADLGALEARAELYHVSSHLGDEFLERTGRDPISTSREGVELLLGGHPVPGLRVYGGPGLLLRSTEELDAASLRAGADWTPDGPRWGSFRPYASAEMFGWAETGWEPMASAEAGLAFGGGRYRLGLMAGAGPSRAEQFLREDESLWGASFSASF